MEELKRKILINSINDFYHKIDRDDELNQDIKIGLRFEMCSKINKISSLDNRTHEQNEWMGVLYDISADLELVNCYTRFDNYDDAKFAIIKELYEDLLSYYYKFNS